MWLVVVPRVRRHIGREGLWRHPIEGLLHTVVAGTFDVRVAEEGCDTVLLCLCEKLPQLLLICPACMLAAR